MMLKKERATDSENYNLPGPAQNMQFAFGTMSSGFNVQPPPTAGAETNQSNMMNKLQSFEKQQDNVH